MLSHCQVATEESSKRERKDEEEGKEELKESRSRELRDSDIFKD